MDYSSKSKLQEEILDAYKSHDKTSDSLVMWGVSAILPQEIGDIQEDYTPLDFVIKIIKSSDGDKIVAQIDEIEIRQLAYNLKNRFDCTKDVIFQIGKLTISKQDYAWLDEIIESKKKKRRSTRLADIAMGNYMKEVIDFYDD